MRREPVKFLFFKEKDSDDRDAVTYLEFNNSCDGSYWYLCGVGPNFSCGLKGMLASNPEYEDIETPLTKEQFDKIFEYDGRTSHLSDDIVDELMAMFTTPEYNERAAEILQSERDYIKTEYDLSDKDLDEIFDHCGDDVYRDRGVITFVHADAEACGEETAVQCGYVPWDEQDSPQSRYFDFEAFGNDLADEDGRFLRLDDGRIVELAF